MNTDILDEFDVSTAVVRFEQEFNELTHACWKLPQDITGTLTDIFRHLGLCCLRPAEDRHLELVAAINSKLKLSYPTYKKILDFAACHGIILNFHDKTDILSSLDYYDRTKFFQVLLRKKVPASTLSALADLYEPPRRAETVQAFSSAAAAENALPLLRATFGAFAFHSFDRRKLLNYFSGAETSSHTQGFYDYLKKEIPSAISRSCGLSFWRVDDSWLETSENRDEVRAKVLEELESLAGQLSNHCYLAILIKPLKQGEGLKWQLYSDLILFAEKHQAVQLKTGYFHPEKIAGQTQAYIPNIDMDECRFDLAHEGLYYKDCFVINYGSETLPHSSQEASLQEPDLLLLFEKNERDETLIPCPACRSSLVQGNSYPVLGVRSWECKNCICPERSKSDRGNRYSLASLIKQEAIEEVEAAIPLSSLRRWKRDVVHLTSDNDVLTMLVRHYSLINDKVVVVNMPVPKTMLGRTLIEAKLGTAGKRKNVSAEEIVNFFEGPYFRRICTLKQKTSRLTFENISSVKKTEVYCGDCFDVLQQIGNDSVDGIVTSPPYYNARDYAHWPNIYCFLYDQFNVAQELYRVLKSGGMFFYNIFDYFDNENNLVFSAMGDKRMILGAYVINLFERAGFNLVRNIVWDKGEIEGKRNFNQGNRSPYYQAPFNCWEHILVFSKGDFQGSNSNLPFVLHAQPVTKIVKGQNILGHTAPYPKSIPNLLLELLESHSTVLDPYAGSMTTARAAYQHGMRSISIDYKEEYCNLGIKLLMEQETVCSQGELF